MNREDVKQTMLLAMSEHHSGNIEEARRIVDAQLDALEAAGVRLVPSEATEEMMTTGRAYLDDMGDDASLEDLWWNMSNASPYAKDTE